MIRNSPLNRFARGIFNGARAGGKRRQARGSVFGVESLETRTVLSTLVYTNGFASNVPAGVSVSTEGVALDAQGNTYVAGEFTGTANFGGISLTSTGNTDVYVAKLNSSGAVLWAKRMGSAQTGSGDFARSVAIDAAGSVYVTGVLSGTGDFNGTTLTGIGSNDIFLAKLDTNGNGVWARVYGSPTPTAPLSAEGGQSVTTDGTNVYLTGIFEGTGTFGQTPASTLTSAGLRDGFVMRVAADNGLTVWAKRMGGADDDRGFSVSLDGSGNVYTTGFYSGTAAFGGVTLNSAGGTDVYVQKLNFSGTVLWAKSFGGTGDDDGFGVAADSAGNAYFTGDFRGTANFGGVVITSQGATSDIFNSYAAKLDTNGNTLWAQQLGGNELSVGFGIATDVVGNVYTTGIYRGLGSFAGANLTSQGGFDVYALVLNPAGTLISSQSFGSANVDQVNQIGVSKLGGVYVVVGSYGAAANIGGGNLGASGGGFVVKYTPSRAPSDFLGFGYTQPAVFRPSTSQWFVQGPVSNSLFGTYGASTDVPVAGTYDGANHAEMAAFSPSTANWSAQTDAGNTQIGAFGAPNLGDIPVPGDYDGIGKTEQAVFRPSTAQWFVLGPNGGRLIGSFGAPGLGDIPAPGDYDGTGKTQLAVFRPSTSQWFVLGPTGGRLLATFGGANLLDIPVPGDYDHTGQTQVAVFRPTTSQWFVLGSTGTGRLLTTFGGPGFLDFPTQISFGSLQIIAKNGGLRGLGNQSGGSGGSGGVRAFSVAPGGQSGGVMTSASTAPATAVTRTTAPAVSAPRAGGVTGRSTLVAVATPTSLNKPAADLWSSAIDQIDGEKNA